MKSEPRLRDFEVPRVGLQATGFVPDDGITLTSASLQTRSLGNRHMAAPVADEAIALQFAGSSRNGFSAHSDRVGDEFVSHDQGIRRRSVEGP
jgi:hypothetical protein